MQQSLDILNALKDIHTVSTAMEEGWGYVRFEGKWSVILFDKLKTMEACFAKHGILNLVKVYIDSSEVVFPDIYDYNKPRAFATWTININKDPFIAGNPEDKEQQNFFLTSASLVDYFSRMNAFDQACPLNNNKVSKIIIADLEEPFGGPSLLFLPADAKYLTLSYHSTLRLPGHELIREHVHFVTSFSAKIYLRKFLLTDGYYSSIVAKAMLKVCSILYAAMIAQEYYSNEKLVLDGLKRVELPASDYEECIYTFYESLTRIVAWLYEDKIKTRKKLFADRLTLEFKPGESLIGTLKHNIDESFQQAKERYSFVILERKDAYFKELKDLLKDLRTQSDLYANKIRSLVTNILRDALAGIVLIGFTIFTRFSDNITLDKAKLLNYVFYGLAVYYLISFTVQLVVDITDVSITGKELEYWKKASKEYIPDAEFEEHRSRSLEKRIANFKLVYCIVGLLYVAIAFACYNYPSILHNLIVK
jgi:hypothetical protein